MLRVPESGLSGPATIRSSVDLPQPEGQQSTRSAPCPADSETSSSARARGENCRTSCAQTTSATPTGLLEEPLLGEQRQCGLHPGVGSEQLRDRAAGQMVGNGEEEHQLVEREL